ncbi:EboA domain-containing protein [Mucilaginibacter corticis]|uniref:EboA domain-containing protein n=1 Tax=Mucilaginibacter corticis TaxID=2597670 RepID=UPI001642B8BE|nr:EboA domain-containing protein [Mucilaginibacter corticis]
MEEIRSILKEIIRANTTPDVFAWLEEKRPLNTAFVLLPRKTGKATINITAEQNVQISAAIPGFTVDGWSIDRLGRAYLLLNVDATDKDEYFRVIEALFLAAEMGELVALYSALPLLSYPEIWVKRCSEGIRSNIGSVLEAIMYHNPYPAQNLDQSAWNQLVLKAFFTDKQIGKITGIDTRANKELAYILSDYAHERWAAKREVNPNLWRLVGPFIDDKLFEDIQRLFDDGTLVDRKAGALAISQSTYPPAKELVNKYPELVTAIDSQKLSWDTLTGQ